MRNEIVLRGKYKTTSWKSEFTGSSYNQGGVLTFKVNGETKRYKISTYEAQDQSACNQIVKQALEAN